MSSDYLDVDDDENGMSISLDMKAGGNAFLTISDDEAAVYYYLSPDKIGLAKADKIISAINQWIEHIRTSRNIGSFKT